MYEKPSNGGCMWCAAYTARCYVRSLHAFKSKSDPKKRPLVGRRVVVHRRRRPSPLLLLPAGWLCCLYFKLTFPLMLDFELTLLFSWLLSLFSSISSLFVD